MTKAIPYILSDNNITLYIDNKSCVISSSQPFFNQIKIEISNKNWDKVKELASSKAIETYSKGTFKVEDDIVYIDGEVLPEVLNKRILQFMSEQLSYEPLVNFWRNLKENPSEKTKKDLYGFLEKNGHPITEDGHFIAYKRVDSDYKSFYDHNVDNSIGSIVKMDRDKCDSDPNRTCSTGLHVANYNYAQNSYYSGRGRLIDVKINPKDVVAIPVDYNQEKMRVCQYEVIAETEGERTEVLYTKDKEQTTNTGPQNDSIKDNVKKAISDTYKLTKELITKTLKDVKGNKTKAAELLKISRSKLYRLRQLHDIKD